MPTAHSAFWTLSPEVAQHGFLPSLLTSMAFKSPTLTGTACQSCPHGTEAKSYLNGGMG